MESSKPSTQKIFKIQWRYFLVILCIWVIWIYSLPVDPDYSAGEMRDVYLSWFETGTLYPSLDHMPYRVLNYPPLFFYLVFFLSKLGIPYLLAGRMLSTFFALGSFWVFYRWLRDFNITGLSAKFILALLLTSFPVFYHIPQFYLQWPAIFFSFLGTYLLSKPDSNRKVFVAAFCFTLACFFKQTQVIPAFIAFVWLLFYFRKKIWVYLSTCTFFAMLGIYFLNMKFGKLVWVDLFTYTVGTYSYSQFFFQLFCHFLPWIFFFALTIYRSIHESEIRKSLLFWYFSGNVIWLFSVARDGASSQYFIEWNLASLLMAAPLVLDLITKPYGKLLKFLLYLQIGAATLGFSGLLIYHALDLQQLKFKLPLLCDKIASSKTPIPSDSPGLVRACGQIPALHPFIMNNLSKRALWNEQNFLQELRDKKFSFILLPFDPNTALKEKPNARWSVGFFENMGQNYKEKDEILDWKIFEPKAPIP